MQLRTMKSPVRGAAVVAAQSEEVVAVNGGVLNKEDVQGLYPLISMTNGRCRKRTKKQKPETGNSKLETYERMCNRREDFRLQTSDVG